MPEHLKNQIKLFKNSSKINQKLNTLLKLKPKEYLRKDLNHQSKLSH